MRLGTLLCSFQLTQRHPPPQRDGRRSLLRQRTLPKLRRVLLELLGAYQAEVVPMHGRASVHVRRGDCEHADVVWPALWWRVRRDTPATPGGRRPGFWASAQLRRTCCNGDPRLCPLTQAKRPGERSTRVSRTMRRTTRESPTMVRAACTGRDAGRALAWRRGRRGGAAALVTTVSGGGGAAEQRALPTAVRSGLPARHGGGGSGLLRGATMGARHEVE